MRDRKKLLLYLRSFLFAVLDMSIPKRHMNPRLLGVIVGGFICFTNARTLLAAIGVSDNAFLLVYGAIVAAWAAAVADAVALAVQPEDDARIPAEYRRELAHTMVTRALGDTLQQLKSTTP